MRVAKEDVEAKIENIQYHRFPGTTLTVCILMMKNGFTATGESACVDPNEFNEDIGKRIAYDNAFNKAWMLEGYLLAEKIHCPKVAVV